MLGEHSLLEEVEAALGTRWKRNVPLARYTSFRIGGPAAWFAIVESEEEIALVQSAARRLGLPVVILGGGTNVLVSDRGVRAVVVRLGRAFSWIEWEEGAEAVPVSAGAAVPLKKLVLQSVERSLEGLEWAEGIPGTLGGGLLMNAGAFGGEIADVLQGVRGVDSDGRAQWIPRSSLRFGYRHFDLPRGFVVTAVRLLLRPGNPVAIRERCRAAKEKREQRQPRGFPNAGSVFKNPPGHYAGKLIEAVGLRGFRLGQAMFSPQHANFIVNLGAARAREVCALMREAQRRVRERFGIELEPEIRVLGECEE